MKHKFLCFTCLFIIYHCIIVSCYYLFLPFHVTNNESKKFSAHIIKKIDDELFYNQKFLKTKIKSHGDEVTDFQEKEIPKVDSNQTCLAVISLDYAFKKDEKQYPRRLVKECKYIEKKVIRHINDISSDFSYFPNESHDK